MNRDTAQQLYDAWLQDAIQDWRIGTVLCSYKKISYYDFHRLVRRWACEIDKKLGKVTRNMGPTHAQRIEKVVMLEYGGKKRYWHANAMLNKPQGMSDSKFITALHTTWLDVLEKAHSKPMNLNNDLFWGEVVDAGFKHYAFKKQALIDKQEWQIRSGHEPTMFECMTIHNQQSELRQAG